MWDVFGSRHGPPLDPGVFGIYPDTSWVSDVKIYIPRRRLTIHICRGRWDSISTVFHVCASLDCVALPCRKHCPVVISVLGHDCVWVSTGKQNEFCV